MGILENINGTIKRIWTLGLAGVQFSLDGSAATANRSFTLPDSDCAVYKNNFTGSDPTTGDDSSGGYQIGSIWVNTSNNQSFLCVDASVGVASWIKTGPSTKIVKFDFLEGTTNNPLTSATSSGTTGKNHTMRFKRSFF